MKNTALITGCSSGIGLATAKHFAEKDWNVVATMREPASHADLAATKDVLVARLDVQDRASIDAAIAAGIARFGKIDALVNNAGYGLNGLFETTPREKIQEQFDVNVFGVMDVTRAILPHFRQNKAGAIVNVSSGAGLFTLPLISLYCASKFALEGFTESLSYELASQNISVKLVIPHGGVTETRFSERNASERAASSNDPALVDYLPFVRRSIASFQKMSAASNVSAGDVAKIIYEAITDKTDRLRYLIGDDARGFVKARRELPDQEYVDFMRSHFSRE